MLRFLLCVAFVTSIFGASLTRKEIDENIARLQRENMFAEHGYRKRGLLGDTTSKRSTNCLNTCFIAFQDTEDAISGSIETFFQNMVNSANDAIAQLEGVTICQTLYDIAAPGYSLPLSALASPPYDDGLLADVMYLLFDTYNVYDDAAEAGCDLVFEIPADNDPIFTMQSNAGVANYLAACYAGYAISKLSGSFETSARLYKHELGHVLGFQHDTEALSIYEPFSSVYGAVCPSEYSSLASDCADPGNGYIMYPLVSIQDLYSACSLSTLRLLTCMAGVYPSIINLDCVAFNVADKRDLEIAPELSELAGQGRDSTSDALDQLKKGPNGGARDLSDALSNLQDKIPQGAKRHSDAEIKRAVEHLRASYMQSLK